MKNKFYITTSIAYTNAEPHIGYALELLQADVLARYHRQKGDDVYFLTGTDEHGKKIKEKAESEGKDTQKFVDEISEKFKKTGRDLGVSSDFFIRTTDKKIHIPLVLEFWEKLAANKDIYKDTYEAFYCTGCEAFLSEKDLDEDGKCYDHKKAPEQVSEENYFFKFSKYAGKIKELIEKDELKVSPESRKKEVLNLLNSEKVADVSFSRPSESVGWGIDVPGDESQKIYVWADALTNYISGLGGLGSENFKKFWPADVHLIGKDILRFHTMIWPAMLLALGLPLPKNILVHGFITHDGIKMSKSLGNVVNPSDLIKKYGKEAVRYYLLREIPSGGDGDFSEERFKERYKNDLQNGLGNLISRVTNLGEKNPNLFSHMEIGNVLADDFIKNIFNDYIKAINDFELHIALDCVWKLIHESDKFIEEKKLWELIKESNKDRKGVEAIQVMDKLLHNLYALGCMIVPFLPDTAKDLTESLGVKILSIESEELKGVSFKKPEPLFPRI